MNSVKGIKEMIGDKCQANGCLLGVCWMNWNITSLGIQRTGKLK